MPTLKSSHLLPLLSLLLLLIVPTTSRNFYYFYDTSSTAYYKCYKDAGNDRILLLLESNIKGITAESVQNIYNAKNAGLRVEVVVVPCRAREPVDQLQLILKNVGANVVDRIWAAPVPTDDNCSWQKYSPESNCLYLQKFLTQTKQILQIPPAIAADAYSWQVVFSSRTSCPEVSTSTQLWWIPLDTEQNLKPDFSNYRPIAGWTTPYMKLYGQFEICKTYLFGNYYV